jgi:short-subunit dehydrogenase
MNIWQGKKILITGASAGIGREFARQLAALGADLILVARREDRLVELKAELQGSVRIFKGDLSNEKDLADVAGYIRTSHVDILINNAGRGSFGYFETIPITEEAEMVRLNITAPLTLAHAIIPQLKERKDGGIITLASIAAFQPLPYMSTYAATKAFDLFHTLGLRYELKPFSVRVLAVCPGPVETEFGGVARVPGTWTGTMRDPVETTVSDSIRAYERNKAFIFPGSRAKLMALARILPLAFTSWVSARSLKPALLHREREKK